MLIENVIEEMLSEDLETVTNFLGYMPDFEVFNNNQLLEEELKNVAKQMPEDILLEFHKASQEKTIHKTEMNYCISTIDLLLREMEECKKELKNKYKMEDIVNEIDSAITNIESLKPNI